jgi:16S rRNA (guanine527-N7)-methyltransferase
MDKPIDTHPRIKEYISLLKQYNSHTNIYSSKAYDHLPFHIENCQILASLITDTTDTSQTIVDMGSGSGLPAIILAICLPKSTIYAIESKRRKTRFLDQVKASLSLENLTVITEDINTVIRARTVTPTVMTAKAFAPYDKVIKLGQKMAAKGAVLYIPISAAQHDELQSISISNTTLLRPQSGHYFLKKLI